MFDIEFNDTVIMEQSRALEAALSTNPDTAKALRKVIRKEIMKARKQVVGGIRFKHGDPRNAAQSVRTVVYKAVLGANINIYNNRKAHGHTTYHPVRKLDQYPHMHGGNRRKRNMRTQQIQSYGPLDRGFILRFQNQGTSPRHIQTTGPRGGNRGSITGKGFFRSAATNAMAQAVSNLSTIIETELQDIIAKKKK